MVIIDWLRRMASTQSISLEKVESDTSLREFLKIINRSVQKMVPCRTPEMIEQRSFTIKNHLMILA